MSERIEKRIESLDEKIEALRQRKRDEKARLRKAERQRDTRRKILLGALVLHDYGEDLSGLPEPWRQRLDAFLSRPDDRELFGLPER